MLPPVANNYDLVVRNSVTPSANLVYNLGQKDLRYLNVYADYVTCSGIGFQSSGDFFGSYNELRDNPEWAALISYSNIGPFMLPPAETNYDIVVQNSLTPSANLVYNLGQKDLRYSTVWCDNLACSNLFFHDNGVFVGSFSGSYNDLRDKPAGGVGSTPEYYEKLSFFPDKSLTLTAQSNSVIAGLNLQTTGT